MDRWWIGAAALGTAVTTERVALNAFNNALPVIERELGDTAATFLPFAVQSGMLLGLLGWLLGAAGGRLTVRSVPWMLALLAGAGGVAVLAPAGSVLLCAAFVMGLLGFGASLLLAAVCERLSSNGERLRLNGRTYGVVEVAYPITLAAVTWLVGAGGWRVGIGVVAVLGPAGCALVALAVAARPRMRVREDGRRGARRVPWSEISRQLSAPGMALNIAGGCATWLALAPFFPLLSRALAADGVGLDALAGLTALGALAAVAGFKWDRVFGPRPLLAVVFGYAPAVLGWTAVLAVELRGDGWPPPARIAAWGVAVIGVHLAWFTTALVMRALVVTVRGGQLPDGTVSVRTALQMAPGMVVGLCAVLLAPLVFGLQQSLASIAAVAIVLLMLAACALRGAHRVAACGNGRA